MLSTKKLTHHLLLYLFFKFLHVVKYSTNNLGCIRQCSICKLHECFFNYRMTELNFVLIRGDIILKQKITS